MCKYDDFLVVGNVYTIDALDFGCCVCGYVDINGFPNVSVVYAGMVNKYGGFAHRFMVKSDIYCGGCGKTVGYLDLGCGEGGNYTDSLFSSIPVPAEQMKG